MNSLLLPRILFASLLYGVAMSPGIYLQFIPFVRQMEEDKARRIWRNVIAICGLEILVLIVLQAERILPFALDSYRKLSFFYWAPTFLYAAVLFRKEIFFSLYIFTIRTLLVIILETITIYVLLHTVGSYILYRYFLLSFCLYTLLMGCLLPFARRYFCQLYAEYIRIPRRRFFRMALPLTGTLALESAWTSYQEDVMAFGDLFQSRLFLLVIVFLVMAAIRQAIGFMADELDRSEEKSHLEEQIGHTVKYVELVEASRKRMGKLRKKRRYYMEKTIRFLAAHDKKGVLALIEELGGRLSKTKVPRCCENNLVNAALTAYLTRAQKENIPVQVMADIPRNLAISAPLSVVLSNLFENAIIASEKQPADRQQIVLLGLRKDTVLNILVKNRCDSPVELGEDGLPVTHEKGHGLGMRSLARFQEKYGANVLCRQDGGWFATYLQVDTAPTDGT